MSSLSRVLILLGLKNDPMDVPADERVLKKMREKLNVFGVALSPTQATLSLLCHLRRMAATPSSNPGTFASLLPIASVCL